MAQRHAIKWLVGRLVVQVRKKYKNIRYEVIKIICCLLQFVVSQGPNPMRQFY